MIIKYIRTLCVAMGAMAVASCIPFNINGSGYQALTPEEKRKVVVCQDDIGNLRNDGRVYQITIEQLQKYLDSAGSVLVYEYLFYCKSEYCVNPATVEQDCRKKGIKFLLITENYGGISNMPPLETPVLAVNPVPYNKKMNKACTSIFFNQLPATTYKTRGYGRYYIFENGRYTGCFNDYQVALAIAK